MRAPLWVSPVLEQLFTQLSRPKGILAITINGIAKGRWRG